MAAVEQVGHPATEQQEPAAEQDVGAHRPLVVARRQVQVGGDAWQRDVHDADVEHDHDLRREHQGEDGPGPARRVGVCGVVGVSLGMRLDVVTVVLAVRCSSRVVRGRGPAWWSSVDMTFSSGRGAGSWWCRC